MLVLGVQSRLWKSLRAKRPHGTYFFVGRFLRLRRNANWQLDSLLSRAGLGHPGKGELLWHAPPEDCFTGLMGSSTQDGTGCTDLQLIGRSVADCQA